MAYEIRERDIGGTLDEAILLFRDQFKFLLLLVVTLLVPINLFLQIAQSRIETTMPVIEPGVDPAGPEMIGYILRSSFPFTPLLLVLIFVSFFVNSFIEGAVIYGIANRYLGKPVSIGASLKVGLRRLPAMLLTNFLIGLAVGLGTMMCFIPGLIAMALFFLGPAVLILENVGPIDAISRSARLVSGYVWQTIALIFVVGIMGMGVGMLAAIIPATLATQIISSVVESAYAGFSPVIMVVLYFSARCRVESLDLDLLVARIDAPPPVPEALL